MAQPPLRSANGSIAVRTTERGLPVALRLDEAALQKPPQQLAEEILALCRLSAARAQVDRRRALAEKGFDASVIRTLRLATESDLCDAEEQVFGADDEIPATWMRQP
ncbi:hypothetical protein H7J88_26735 [Mycolicibacterium flavescens]|uniref:Uncharacterized protein n=1 Tax=Mycolicibacterium flavescens TaxID=1776 RepID=A0A1E3RPR9_MYCFV|nr:hypothetical protein [Mycolicibacterium flavescens]MCV7283238.1 hypothetical protein [Mycolicibacterium flavescens]ODQ91841.1 hypothetical protein BHQ18_02990 [Mycolicibacterium flavescens]